MKNPIVEICETKFNVTLREYTVPKIIKALLNEEETFSNFILREYHRIGSRYMYDTYKVFTENREFFDSKTNQELLSILEGYFHYFPSFNVENYDILKKNDIIYIFSEFSGDFRGTIERVIDLGYGNYIIETLKHDEKNKSFYALRDYGRDFKNRVYGRIQDAIGSIYSSHDSIEEFFDIIPCKIETGDILFLNNHWGYESEGKIIHIIKKRIKHTFVIECIKSGDGSSENIGEVNYYDSSYLSKILICKKHKIGEL